VNACKKLGIEDVDVEIKPFSKVLVIESNRYREKTWEEKLKEAEEIEKILRPEAERREKAGKKLDPVQTFGQGKTIHKVAEKIGTSHETLRKAKTIKEKKPELLKAVDKGSESINSAYRKIKREGNKKKILSNMAIMELPKDKFQIVLADPPWEYEKNSIDQSRRIENQYPTMKLQEICKLRVSKITTENSMLFLWTTSSKLEESMFVIRAWQYNYRTCMIWVKDKIGMGYYVRQQHELLLIAKRGIFPSPVPGTQHSSIINAPRLEHSKKPDIVYEIIEKMYPGFKYIELFSRKKRDNWRSWGNETI
jgi:N6-adenosine-specific RNA methylase IME4